MYTAELGIVTAGFLFMALVLLSTLAFGRFFCGWACHILALEDLCAWALQKLRIRPKPVRSLVLAWVGPAAAFYMFLWPQLTRLFSGEPLPKLRVAEDASGWASFVTEDYWRNLPGPGIAVFTFLVCGFAIVYILGSRSFCRYVCPYGAIFRVADRLSISGIRLRRGFDSADCLSCGACTAVCQSHIRVHEEIAHHGRVVSPECLKDLDCVSVCPEHKLKVGFGTPALIRDLTGPAFKKPGRDYSWRDEVLAAFVMAITFLSLRGLYGEVPFLLALALGTIAAYLAVKAYHLATRPNVRFNDFQLKTSGRWSSSGFAFVFGALLLGVLIVHSGFVRWHEYAGNREYELLGTQMSGGPRSANPELIQSCLSHYETCASWGFVRSAKLDRALASLYGLTGQDTKEREALERLTQSDPGDIEARLRLAPLLVSQGQVQEALRELRLASKSPPRLSREREQNLALRADALRMEAEIHMMQGESQAAEDALRASLGFRETDLARACLAKVFAARNEYSKAQIEVRRAIALHPNEVHWTLLLSEVLEASGRSEEALDTLRGAADKFALDPRPLYLLGMLREKRGERALAKASYESALERDPGFHEAQTALKRLGG